MVVDKPSGVPSQGTADGQPGLDTLLAGPERPRVALHHRLDQPASGLMLLATHPDADAPLTEQFRAHRPRRTYLAVLAGGLDRLGPPGPGPADGPRRVRWDAPLDGRAARSTLTVLGAKGGLVAGRLTLHTGRTHQLRRHAAAAGLPLLGDRRYGGEVGGWAPRLQLHAVRLALPHPVTGAPLRLQAPLPDDLATAWRAAGGPVGEALSAALDAAEAADDALLDGADDPPAP